MKLFYYIDDVGNFGDDLNPLIWNAMLPEGFFDGQDDTLFVGIGSLLNSQLNSPTKKIVFGSGVGYLQPPELDSSWDIRFVRGPRSADFLGLSPNKAICDPAVLIHELGYRRATNAKKIGFMTHHYSALSNDWSNTLASTGIELVYISPIDSPESVLRKLRQCEALITEALHGAICSDAMRIPWVPIQISSKILEFKWLDWCESVGLNYKPWKLPFIHDFSYGKSRREIGKNQIKRLLKRLEVWNPKWDPPYPPKNHKRYIDEFTAEVARIISSQPWMLSQDGVIESKCRQIQDEIIKLS